MDTIADNVWMQAHGVTTTNSTSYSEQYRLYQQQYYNTWRQQHEYQLAPQGVQLRSPIWEETGTVPEYTKKINRKILLLL